MSNEHRHFVCIYKDHSTELFSAKEMREYLDIRYAEAYNLVRNGKYFDVMINNVKIAIVKRYGV